MELTPAESVHGPFRLSTDPSLLQLTRLHRFLTETYWAKGISRARVARSIAHSLCAGAYAPTGEQVGFARLVTDYTRFGWLCDVYVAEGFRRQGLGRALCALLLEVVKPLSLRAVLLGTADAHGVYAKLGFAPLAEPGRLMHLDLNPDEAAISEAKSINCCR